jgi:hypothetical protein
MYGMEVKFDSTGGSHLETPEADINTWTAGIAEFLQEGRKS